MRRNASIALAFIAILVAVACQNPPPPAPDMPQPTETPRVIVVVATAQPPAATPEPVATSAPKPTSTAVIIIVTPTPTSAPVATATPTRIEDCSFQLTLPDDVFVAKDENSDDRECFYRWRDTKNTYAITVQRLSNPERLGMEEAFKVLRLNDGARREQAIRYGAAGITEGETAGLRYYQALGVSDFGFGRCTTFFRHIVRLFADADNLDFVYVVDSFFCNGSFTREDEIYGVLDSFRP